MSRKKKFKPQQPAPSAIAHSTRATAANQQRSKLFWWLASIPAAIAILLYIQTLQYQYALDDITVITQNKLVQKGFAGIPELLKTDYWYGFTDRVRGHQYRPLSLVMFAIEHQLAPGSPMLSHLVNVLLYALTGTLLFVVLHRLFSSIGLFIPFVATILFIAHPIHTEVVSNIKSRDEILCLFLALGSLYAALRYFKSTGLAWMVLSGFLFLMALMSKETAIAFVILIPLSGYFAGHRSPRQLVFGSLILLAFTGLYFAVRFMAVQDMQSAPIDPYDNTVMLAQSKSEEIGTAFSILLRYIGLLLVPVKLSYDYSYAQLPIVPLGSASAIIGVLVYLGLLVWALRGLRSKKLSSWAILFFLISLAPVSNLFLKIGSTMAERFLYMPSVGFCVLIAALLAYAFRAAKKSTGDLSRSFFSTYSTPLLIVFVITVLYAGRTITRNKVWENNISLFKSGLESAPNSARVHYNWGTTLLNQLFAKSTDAADRRSYLMEAKTELEESGRIYPNSIFTQKNIGAVYINTGEYQKAIPILSAVLQKEPNDTTTLKNMGRCYAYSMDFATAAKYFENCIRIAPQVAENYQLAGSAYQFMGDINKANQYFAKAKQLQ